MSKIGQEFFVSGLCFHCNMAEKELRYFLQFNHESEKAWNDKDQELQSHIDSILEKFPDHDHSEIIESYGWDLHVNQFKYPNIHRESTVLTIFSFLEKELNNLCDILSRFIDSDLKFKDLSGQGVERALLYLRKVIKFKFATSSKEISYIRGFNQVRNHIVHNGGELPENQSHKLNKFIQSNKNITGNPGGSLTILNSFIPELIEILISFFNKLDGDVQGFIQTHPENVPCK